jgi:hypothetical protein
MQTNDMCSECASPADWHSFGTTVTDAGVTGGLCPMWPRWTQKIEKVRRDLIELSKRPPQLPAAKPEPIAIIPSRLPIEEILARLTAQQAEHPRAQVRRGNHNRWEIWPARPYKN